MMELFIIRYLNKRKYILVLMLILLLSAFLRLHGIKWGLPNQSHFFSYSPDEYTIFHWLSQMNPSQFDFNIHTYFNGSIFVYILAIVFKVLSLLRVIVLTTSREFYHIYPLEWAKLYLIARLTMVFFGIFTVYGIYLAGKNLYNEKVGLISSLLFSILPLHVVFSHQMIIDVFVIFCVSFSFVFLSKILFSNAWRWYILAGIAISVSIVSKVTTIVLLPFIFLCHILREKRLIIEKKLIVSYLVTILFYFLFNPYLVFNLKEAKEHLLVFYSLTTTTWKDLGYNWLWQVFNLSQYGFGLPLFVLCFAGILLGLALRKRNDLIILSWIIINFIIISKTGTPFIKYYLIIVPFIIILGARFIHFLLEKRKIIRYATVAIFIPIIFFTLISSLAYDRLMASQDVRDKASEWIISNIPKGSKIGIAREPYYFSPPIIFNQYFYTGKSKYIRDKNLYNIINFNYDIETLSKEEPEYVILTDTEFCGQDLEHIGQFPDMSIPAINYFLIENNYELMKKFNKPDYIKWFLFKNKNYPRDFLFLMPTIYIYKKEIHKTKR